MPSLPSLAPPLGLPSTSSPHSPTSETLRHFENQSPSTSALFYNAISVRTTNAVRDGSSPEPLPIPLPIGTLHPVDATAPTGNAAANYRRELTERLDAIEKWQHDVERRLKKAKVDLQSLAT